MDITSSKLMEKYSHLEQISQDMSSTCLDRIISRMFDQINLDFFSRVKQITSNNNSVDVFTNVRMLSGWIKETLIAHALDVFEVF